MQEERQSGEGLSGDYTPGKCYMQHTLMVLALDTTTANSSSEILKVIFEFTRDLELIFRYNPSTDKFGICGFVPHIS